MASVGAKSYISLTRGSLKPGEQVQLLRRPGVNGVALRSSGVRGEMQRHTGVVDVVAADADALATEIAAHYALRGTKVSVVDDQGITTTNIWIMKADAQARKIEAAVGGLVAEATHLLTVEFTWIDTNTA